MARRSAVRPWAAALAGGLAGTTAMTIGLALEGLGRDASAGPVDYDASDHVVTAACAVLRRPVPRSARARRRIFNVVHWGYGSAVAAGYEALRRGLDGDERASAAVFYGGCQAMAFTLFPTLGGTPPPWRWERELLVSSLTMHALYVATVATVSRRLR